MRRRSPMILSLLLVAGCASRHRPPVVTVAVPPPVVALAALPDGASPGMLVPLPLADGRFPTPNQGLDAAGVLWHLRTGLNVAALSCPGEEGAAIRAGYNRWLGTAGAPLGRAVVAYAAGYPGGRGAYDDAMTRLYNFWAQTPARSGFCAVARSVVAEMAAAAPTTLPAVAPALLDRLDQPFVAFYRAYDAWRRGRAEPVIATAAVTPPVAAPPIRLATARRRTPLILDLSTLPIDPTPVAAR